MSRHGASVPTSAGAEALLSSVAALIGEAGASGDQFGIAVSGGPDSLALLVLANAAMPGRVAAASVDHRLRPEAADECTQVAAMCSEMGVPHTILTPDAPPPANQAAARDLRYDMLEIWRAKTAIDWLMTGHHADDQLETLVMRLNRSSGVGGLAGVRARNGRVLRPLLGWRRDDLAAIVEGAGLTAVDDPSNRNPKHDRARLRMAMAGQDWLDPVAATASAANLAQAEEALAWAASQLIETYGQRQADGVEIIVGNWPAELLRRVVAEILADGAGQPPRGAELDRFVARLSAGQSASLRGWTVKPGRNQPELWRFRPERGRQRK